MTKSLQGLHLQGWPQILLISPRYGVIQKARLYCARKNPIVSTVMLCVAEGIQPIRHIGALNISTGRLPLHVWFAQNSRLPALLARLVRKATFLANGCSRPLVEFYTDCDGVENRWILGQVLVCCTSSLVLPPRDVWVLHRADFRIVAAEPCG